ncbi:DMT family transporter [Paenibacillus radicis (ex Gao et al. 2016)]|uniref:Membrane protein YvaE n=1 Tax=Paenibacillus radicis (ex Gao et al. 2016) TaxID=1737354 RepID=A0A917LWS4_9BACL|nr:multidrug efflux SMR transporter [Paenibacillus radicis (ex Gao et al. 2016)]GGG62551.1 putative membrane protein YvaE [Paenibacillus radicis (ex Gao et al. 2016)]
MKEGNGIGWLFLSMAILLEVLGTMSMKWSESFTRLLPSILMFIFYGASFTSLNYTLGYMSVSTVYATWSGVGIVLISLIGYFIFQEKLSIASVCWIAVIVIGVVGLNASTKGH